MSAIIIGAGPAGLAVGACLTRAGVPFVILERENSVGASWRGHYDRLHLHTSKGTSALPFLPFPRDYPTYPSRDQVVEYLETYAETFDLEPHFNEEVVSVRPCDEGWEVRTNSSTYHASHVVVATGLNREPVVPQWPDSHVYEGRILHSAEYRIGAEFRGRRVLVVGFGNSGAEIALDLHEHGAEPTVSVRSAVNVIPRDIFGIPIVRVAVLSGALPPTVADVVNAPLLRLLVGDLRPYGLEPLPYGPMTQIERDGRIPMIDVGTIRLIKEGRIVVRPGIERFFEEGVVFADGTREAFDAVVLATGFRARLDSFIEVDGVCDDEGNPQCDEEALPEGLHLCGFSVVATGVLKEIGREAKRVAEKIAEGDPERVAAASSVKRTEALAALALIMISLFEPRSLVTFGCSLFLFSGCATQHLPQNQQGSRMRHVTSRDGTRIGFVQSGTGPALLLVHGTTADHSRWSSISPYFEPEFTVYAMDRRGRGESTDSPEYDIAREAEDIAAVVEAIGEPVFVLGHSYGANCSLEASLLTNRIRRIILYEPDVSTGDPVYSKSISDRMQELITEGRSEAAVEILFREIVQMPESEIEAYRERPVWKVRVSLAHTIPRELDVASTYMIPEGKFAGMNTPTMLLLGGDSPPLVRRSTELLNSALPDSRIVILPGQQHNAMDTDPELFVREVRRFLLP